MADGTDEHLRAQLQRHGLHVTAQRLAVLRAVAAVPHATPNDIAERVRADLGNVSQQAVYDALATLTDKRVLRRIQPAGSAPRYEDRVGDNHHHVICRVCGRTVDVDCAVGSAPCLAADDPAGFEIDEAEVIYWGRCPDCRTDQNPTNDTNHTNDPNPTKGTP